MLCGLACCAIVLAGVMLWYCWDVVSFRVYAPFGVGEAAKEAEKAYRFRFVSCFVAVVCCFCPLNVLRLAEPSIEDGSHSVPTGLVCSGGEVLLCLLFLARHVAPFSELFQSVLLIIVAFHLCGICGSQRVHAVFA